MSSPKLGSYLRTYRLRAGLTQRDVAMLLGLETGSTISRTEKSKEIPSVLILLGYCVLFDANPEELAPGTFRKIESTISSRVDVLAEKLRKCPKTPTVLARINFLENLSQGMAGRTPRKYEQSKKNRNS